ncbi:hypothetical protein FF1_008683 [Malus domestica]
MKPFLGMATCEASQVGLNAPIHHLNMLITLRMVPRAHAQFRALQLEKLLPEGTQENGVPVTDNSCEHAMQFEYIVHKGLSHNLGNVGKSECNEMGKFGQPIHHHHNDRLTLVVGKARDKIHFDILPYLIRNGQGL